MSPLKNAYEAGQHEAQSKFGGFLQAGARQIGTMVNNPGQIARGAGKLYNAGGGGLGGMAAVAKHYAPGAAMVAAPVALGAMGAGMMGGGQQMNPQQQGANAAAAQYMTTMASEKTAFSVSPMARSALIGGGIGAAAMGGSTALQDPEDREMSPWGAALSGGAMGAASGALMQHGSDTLRTLKNMGGGGKQGPDLAKRFELRDQAEKARAELWNLQNQSVANMPGPTKASSDNSMGPEVRKLANMMQMVGRGLGTAGKAVGIVPGVGTAIGAGLGAVGGAMSAPPGKRMLGAGLGAATGAMGPIAGTVANVAGSKLLGV